MDYVGKQTDVRHFNLPANKSPHNISKITGMIEWKQNPSSVLDIKLIISRQQRFLPTHSLSICQLDYLNLSKSNKKRP